MLAAVLERRMIHWEVFRGEGHKFIVIESGEKLISFLPSPESSEMVEAEPSRAELTRRTVHASGRKYLIGFSFPAAAAATFHIIVSISRRCGMSDH